MTREQHLLACLAESVAAALAQARAEGAEDRARLDWLDRHSHDWQKYIVVQSDGSWGRAISPKASVECHIRTAIDAAIDKMRKEEG